MVHWEIKEVVQAIVGGLIISASSSLHYLLYGKITGMSGIWHTLYRRDVKAGLFWKICFVVGLVFIPLIFYLASGNTLDLGNNSITLFDKPKVFLESTGLVELILSGIIVGIGTKMGNGCTSGHGVCGIARLSIRSIAAVCTFMSFGILLASLKQENLIVKVDMYS